MKDEIKHDDFIKKFLIAIAIGVGLYVISVLLLQIFLSDRLQPEVMTVLTQCLFGLFTAPELLAGAAITASKNIAKALHAKNSDDAQEVVAEIMLENEPAPEPDAADEFPTEEEASEMLSRWREERQRERAQPQKKPGRPKKKPDAAPEKRGAKT